MFDELSESDGDSDVSDLDAKQSRTLEGAQLIVGTAFDAYLSQSLSISRTSANVFGSLVQPLTTEEYSTALASSTRPVTPLVSTSCHRSTFPRFMRELEEGFNLIFYGMGSKREPINAFASNMCSRKGHVVVANAFLPNFSIKELLSAIERVPGVLDFGISTGGIEKQVRRIYDFFSVSPRRRLFLVIHNIDAPTLRSVKAKACLSLLASNPCIHLIASVDRINTSLLWSSSESLVRKQHHDHTRDRRGYAWLWHDLTTLNAYDIELAHADRSSIMGVAALYSNVTRRQDVSGVPAVGAPMTETAATHILASVTQKAKKAFLLLGTKQIESMDEATDIKDANAQQHAIAYDLLFNFARDNFIATNDTAMRSLLGEFRDHGLVVSAAQGGPGSGELLWIPMRKERLLKILGALNEEQQG